MFIITNGIVASRIGWETEPVAMTANQAMAADAAGGEHQIDEAVKLLRDLLAEGPVTAKQVKDEADGACISWRTIKRAKGKLGIISEKPDMASGWVWTLLEGGQQCRRVPTLKGGPLREIWPPSEAGRPLETPSGQGAETKL
jgi:hypothetical protein